jgi:hypothetical protein
MYSKQKEIAVGRGDLQEIYVFEIKRVNSCLGGCVAKRGGIEKAAFFEISMKTREIKA